MTPLPEMADATGATSTAARRTLLRRGAIAAVVVAAMVYVAGVRRVPTGPAHGGEFQSPVTATVVDAVQRSEFVVGTFNIHGGKGTDGRRDLARTASVIAGADFVGLNEVRGPEPFGGGNQAEALAGRLGTAWHFAPTETQLWQATLGNAALTSLDVRRWQCLPLPRAGAKSHRNVLWVTVSVGNQPVQLLITHVERSNEAARREQLAAVSDWFLALSPPVVLLGDLNSDADDPLLRRLTATPGVRDPLAESHPGPLPRRIDWILTRGLRSVAAGVVPTEASDHPYIWARLATLEWSPDSEAEPAAPRPLARRPKDAR